MSSLAAEALRVLELAQQRVGDEARPRERLAEAHRRLDEPLRVAVAGRIKAGKSTLVNAMVGELIAPTDARECTRVVTWYRDGVTYRVEGLTNDGERAPLRFDRDGGCLSIDLGARLPEQLSCIDVTWPSKRLREMTLVDTPGIDSLTADASERTERFLTGDSDRPTPTDAVVYLLRHVHTGDLRFLEAFHDDRMAAANPVNSIGVLSRADEIGAARADAMDSARRIAGRWRADRRLAALVQTVVPVAGLLAEAASTLRQAEYEAIAQLAAADESLIDELLVTADRFGSSSAPVGVVDSERRVLLDRLGLFGARLAIDAVRAGRATGASQLAEQLLTASGLPQPRTEIADRFARRRDLLKARNALFVAHQVAVSAADTILISEVERVLDGAHEFAELRVLNALRRGAIRFDDRRSRSADHLLGEQGMLLAQRAGLGADAEQTEVADSLAEQLAMWQSQAEHPLATPDVAAAARVLTRTCEGLIAASR